MVKSIRSTIETFDTGLSIRIFGHFRSILAQHDEHLTFSPTFPIIVLSKAGTILYTLQLMKKQKRPITARYSLSKFKLFFRVSRTAEVLRGSGSPTKIFALIT